LQITGDSFVSDGAGVVASNHFGISNETDVFAVGAGGALQVFWDTPSAPWSGPLTLTGQNYHGLSGVAASLQFGT
jgi:hypothetical protein